MFLTFFLLPLPLSPHSLMRALSLSELIQRHEITHAFLVPPILVALAKHPIVDKYKLTSLKYAAVVSLSLSITFSLSPRPPCLSLSLSPRFPSSLILGILRDHPSRYGFCGAYTPPQVHPLWRRSSRQRGANCSRQEVRTPRLLIGFFFSTACELGFSILP